MANPLPLVALVAGEAAAVGWAAWSLRRLLRERAAKGGASRPGASPSEAARHSEGEHGPHDGGGETP